MVKTVSTHISSLAVKCNTLESTMESDLKVKLIVMDHSQRGWSRKRDNEGRKREHGRGICYFMMSCV